MTTTCIACRDSYVHPSMALIPLNLMASSMWDLPNSSVLDLQCEISSFMDSYVLGCPEVGASTKGLWSIWCFSKLEVFFVGVLVSALLFGVYIRAPDFWKLRTYHVRIVRGYGTSPSLIVHLVLHPRDFPGAARAVLAPSLLYRTLKYGPLC